MTEGQSAVSSLMETLARFDYTGTVSEFVARFSDEQLRLLRGCVEAELPGPLCYLGLGRWQAEGVFDTSTIDADVVYNTIVSMVTFAQAERAGDGRMVWPDKFSSGRGAQWTPYEKKPPKDVALN